MNITISNSFHPENTDIFRKKSLRKGKKLVAGFDVSEVMEEVCNLQSNIYSSVLRETLGAHSTRKKENIHKPIVEVITGDLR